MVKSYACFVPHSDGGDGHKNLTGEPFATEENVWIGYRNDPSRKYRDYPSFLEVAEMCEENVVRKKSDVFPQFITYVQPHVRAGEPPLGVPFVRQAFCTACLREHKLDDQSTIEYIEVAVKINGQETKVFLLSYNFTLHNESMIALVKHCHNGLYAFQKTDGSTTSTMFVNTDNAHFRVSNKSGAHSKASDGANTESEPAAEHPVGSFHPTTSSTIPWARRSTQTQKVSGIVDFTIATNNNNLQANTHGSASSPQQQLSSHQNAVPNDIMKEYGELITLLLKEYGVEAYGRVGAREMRMRMREAAQRGDRDTMYQVFGNLSAIM